MKELSIEEKARRYDEAIERAKNTIEVNQTIPDIIECVKSLFPELKSEDEKIKKAIKYGLDYVFTNNTTVYETTKEQCLTWLEKQGEPEWNEEDEINLREALHHIRMYNLANKADILDEWLRSLKDRLQPRQEGLRDEDKENLGLIIEALKSCTNDPDTYSKQIEWLENKVK